LNLHSIVRGAITSVNPDTPSIWLKGVGYTTLPNGVQIPIYQPFFNVPVQVQGLSNQDLQHINYLNLEGVLRKVYAYSAVNGAVRAAFQGGDLLVFNDWNPVGVKDASGQWVRDSSGQIVMTYSQRYWKVVQVSERWPDNVAQGWTSAIIWQQTDSTQFVLDSNGKIVVDSNGHLVTSQ
jgi:hypothetical protein